MNVICPDCKKSREYSKEGIKRLKSFYCFSCYLKKPFTKEHKDNISKSLRGSKHQYWKGDLVSYEGIHDWVARNFGKMKMCEHCGTTSAKKFEWANRSGYYTRKRDDWMRLCTSCHRYYDSRKRKRSVFSKIYI